MIALNVEKKHHLPPNGGRIQNLFGRTTNKQVCLSS